MINRIWFVCPQHHNHHHCQASPQASSAASEVADSEIHTSILHYIKQVSSRISQDTPNGWMQLVCSSTVTVHTSNKICQTHVHHSGGEGKSSEG